MAHGVKTGGRQAGTPNKTTASVKELAQQYVEDALSVLSDIMRDDTAPHAARVAAANSLLDRGYGKPKPTTDGEQSHDNVVVIKRLIVDRQ